TMASAEFGADSEAKRPTVQVGDPFKEKLLLEACLELMATDAIIAIQDMGAAGLTSSSVEMASKGGVGIALDLDQVPLREDAMSAYEIMLSESQERMLMVLRPDREDEARRIFEKWELDFSVIGQTTETGRLILSRHGEIAADIPVPPLVDAAPEYDRPWEPSPGRAVLQAGDLSSDLGWGDSLERLLGSPDLCSRRWIWEQYDHMVMADTVVRPGGDAAVVRVHGSDRALAMTTDCTPRYVLADPETGGRQAVVEAWRNLCAVGARPLAVTNNLNFGNPERPVIMGQLVLAVRGMGEACRALDFPVVSGNVSLYNETDGRPILPTPVIGGVGLLDDVEKRCGLALPATDDHLIVLGETHGWLGASLWLREILGREDGAPPPVDLAAERRAGDLVRSLIDQRRVIACHDVGDGGLMVAVAEMALVGDCGANIAVNTSLPLAAFLFGEDQGRYVLATSQPDQVLAAAQIADVPAAIIGRCRPERGEQAALTVNGGDPISLSRLRRAHETWLPRYMMGNAPA
ncbi:MAG: phosphoribosylformylglycinamidine synthase subunit PurL, partial [Alphaproteobacteria bacterium]